VRSGARHADLLDRRLSASAACQAGRRLNPRKIDGFFYGLFMDAEVLHQAGMQPSNFRRAYVDDFALRIGRRATLVPLPGGRACGMLISLTHAEMERLYSMPGLEGYRPEAIAAHPFDENELVPALCYNLLQPPEPHERNPEYAMRLRRTLENLGFPVDYVESVR